MTDILLQNKYNELTKALAKASSELTFAELETKKLKEALETESAALLKATGAKSLEEVESLLSTIEGLISEDLDKASKLLNGDYVNEQ